VAGNDPVLVLSPVLVCDSSRLPLDTKPSCNAPREFLRTSDPRIGEFAESGGKYPIEDCRRAAFISAVVVGDRKGLRVGIVSEHRFGGRKLEGGDGKEKASLVGVGVVAEIASWSGRGVWMAMVAVVEVHASATAGAINSSLID